MSYFDNSLIRYENLSARSCWPLCTPGGDICIALNRTAHFPISLLQSCSKYQNVLAVILCNISISVRRSLRYAALLHVRQGRHISKFDGKNAKKTPLQQLLTILEFLHLSKTGQPRQSQCKSDYIWRYFVHSGFSKLFSLLHKMYKSCIDAKH